MNYLNFLRLWVGMDSINFLDISLHQDNLIYSREILRFVCGNLECLNDLISARLITKEEIWSSIPDKSTFNFYKCEIGANSVS